MDSLLAGKLPPFQGTLPAIVMSSAAQPVEIIPGHRKSRSGAARKLFAFPPESLFVFSPESCSSSTGTLFAFTPESFSPCPGIRNQLGRHRPFKI